ncbi:alpha-ribazole phosphatase [Reichenbachiella ulvae]|uniref:Alpha-ribazole phosphatase n=1 Tax=Reichenbachiella ulvae TaxID=2980104 RepID=A0ABT3CQ61_9BACT|nr:alpha-ribazole phosphatase [Reichenbachiella ulvae]MCV9385757.1 alpha-ribazole phosphatase [Reichenbachiella ulvae]
MEIYLVRHTTPDVPKGTCYGQSDLPLAMGYQKDLAQTQSLLPEKLGAVYSSPLLRCKTLAWELEGEINFDARLKELNFGDWELKKWEDIPKEQLNPWMESYVELAPPKGESYLQLAERVKAFWNELLEKELDTVAIISHGGVIRALLSIILDLDLKNSFKLQIDYGSVSQVSINQKQITIQYINKV